MIVFATLGPAGTNHELVTKRYLAFHGIDARIELVTRFDDAIEGLKSGAVDFVIQCAVHTDTPRIMGENFRAIYVIDTFISPSKDLAILTRADVAEPKTIALIRPSTESYADLSPWPELVHDISIPIILGKMLEGVYDSGLVYLEYAEQYPGRFRVDRVIGSPDDAWIVYGRERTYRDGVLAWRDSPAAALYRARASTT